MALEGQPVSSKSPSKVHDFLDEGFAGGTEGEQCIPSLMGSLICSPRKVVTFYKGLMGKIELLA